MVLVINTYECLAKVDYYKQPQEYNSDNFHSENDKNSPVLLQLINIINKSPLCKP